MIKACGSFKENTSGCGKFAWCLGFKAVFPAHRYDFIHCDAAPVLLTRRCEFRMIGKFRVSLHSSQPLYTLNPKPYVK